MPDCGQRRFSSDLDRSWAPLEPTTVHQVGQVPPTLPQLGTQNFAASCGYRSLPHKAVTEPQAGVTDEYHRGEGNHHGSEMGLQR